MACARGTASREVRREVQRCDGHSHLPGQAARLREELRPARCPLLRWTWNRPLISDALQGAWPTYSSKATSTLLQGRGATTLRKPDYIMTCMIGQWQVRIAPAAHPAYGCLLGGRVRSFHWKFNGSLVLFTALSGVVGRGYVAWRWPCYLQGPWPRKTVAPAVITGVVRIIVGRHRPRRPICPTSIESLAVLAHAGARHFSCEAVLLGIDVVVAVSRILEL